MKRMIALAFALTLGAASAACAQIVPDAPVGDPAHRDTVIEYGGPDPVIVETSDGPVQFNALIAETDEQRQRGMMWREEVAADEGMLFDFQQERMLSIWMRNTLVGLDIIYIRADGTIAKIVAHAQPRSLRSMGSGMPALGVLEIAGGRAAETGIEPGDLVRHAMFGTADTPEAANDNAPEAANDNAAGEAEPAADTDEAAAQEG